MKKRLIYILTSTCIFCSAFLMTGCGDASDEGAEGADDETLSEVVNAPSDVTDYDAYIQDALNKAKGGNADSENTEAAPGQETGESSEVPEKVIYVDKPKDKEEPETPTSDSLLVSAADPVGGITDPISAPLPEVPDYSAMNQIPTIVPGTSNTSTSSTGTSNTSTSSTGTVNDATPTPDVPYTPEDFPVGVCLVYVKGENNSGYASGIIDRINTIRTEMGYPELTENDGLNKCADMRVREIATFVSHTRPDGSLYNSLAPKYYKAELLAACATTEEETVDAWVWYPSSRSLIFTRDYTTIGASCFEFNGLDYVVVSLGR